jgi:hypothetical protein
VLSDARELASDLSARSGYIIPATPDLIESTGFYPIREAAPECACKGPEGGRHGAAYRRTGSGGVHAG